MRAFKLFRVRKDGSIGPLFINRAQRVPLGEWLPAEDVPTKGFAHRPGWHAGASAGPCHLSERGRVWFEVEIEDYYRFPRPANQGGEWFIAQRMRVVGAVSAAA